MRVFLVANTYAIHLIATGISFVTNGYVDELIVLKEVLPDSKLLFGCDARISICESAITAISKCDQVWIVFDKIMSLNKMCSIREMASFMGKTVLELSDPWCIEPINDQSNCYIKQNDYNCVLPKILIATIGKKTQLYSLEVWVIKRLFEENAKIYFEQSKMTKEFFLQLKRYDMINRDIFSYNHLEKPDLILESYFCDFFDYSKKSWNDVIYVSNSHADLIILLIDRCFLDHYNLLELENRFAYRCGVQPDIIVLSNFRSINISESQCKYILCDAYDIEDNQKLLLLNDVDIAGKFGVFLNKITAPQGISSINISCNNS